MNASRTLALPVLLAALLAAGTAALAQTDAPAPAASGAPVAAPHAHHRGAMRRALDTLDLSADQKTQIRGFMKSFHASRTSANPETRQELLAQIDGALTPDQRTRFSAAMQQMRRAHRAAPAAAPSAAP